MTSVFVSFYLKTSRKTMSSNIESRLKSLLDEYIQQKFFLYRSVEPVAEKPVEFVSKKPKVTFVTAEDLDDIDLTNSRILDCVVRNKTEVITTQTRYMTILADIWNTMSVNDVVENSLYEPFQTQKAMRRHFASFGKKVPTTYKWNEAVGLYTQYLPNNHTIQEIANMIQFNNYNCRINIILANGDNITFKM